MKSLFVTASIMATLFGAHFVSAQDASDAQKVPSDTPSDKSAKSPYTAPPLRLPVTNVADPTKTIASLKAMVIRERAAADQARQDVALLTRMNDLLDEVATLKAQKEKDKNSFATATRDLNASSRAVQDAEQRVDQLERENRRLKSGNDLAGTIIIVVLLVGSISLVGFIVTLTITIIRGRRIRRLNAGFEESFNAVTTESAENVARLNRRNETAIAELSRGYESKAQEHARRVEQTERANNALMTIVSALMENARRMNLDIETAHGELASTGSDLVRSELLPVPSFPGIVFPDTSQPAPAPAVVEDVTKATDNPPAQKPVTDGPQVEIIEGYGDANLAEKLQSSPAMPSVDVPTEEPKAAEVPPPGDIIVAPGAEPTRGTAVVDIVPDNGPSPEDILRTRENDPFLVGPFFTGKVGTDRSSES